jgi:hypothetical protein
MRSYLEASKGPKGLIDLQRGTNTLNSTRLVIFSPVYFYVMLQGGPKWTAHRMQFAQCSVRISSTFAFLS